MGEVAGDAKYRKDHVLEMVRTNGMRVLSTLVKGKLVGVLEGVLVKPVSGPFRVPASRNMWNAPRKSTAG